MQVFTLTSQTICTIKIRLNFLFKLFSSLHTVNKEPKLVLFWHCITSREKKGDKNMHEKTFFGDPVTHVFFNSA